MQPYDYVYPLLLQVSLNFRKFIITTCILESPSQEVEIDAEKLEKLITKMKKDYESRSTVPLTGITTLVENPLRDFVN